MAKLTRLVQLIYSLKELGWKDLSIDILLYNLWSSSIVVQSKNIWNLVNICPFFLNVTCLFGKNCHRSSFFAIISAFTVEESFYARDALYTKLLKCNFLVFWLRFSALTRDVGETIFKLDIFFLFSLYPPPPPRSPFCLAFLSLSHPQMCCVALSPFIFLRDCSMNRLYR